MIAAAAISLPEPSYIIDMSARTDRLCAALAQRLTRNPTPLDSLSSAQASVLRRDLDGISGSLMYGAVRDASGPTLRNALGLVVAHLDRLALLPVGARRTRTLRQLRVQAALAAAAARDAELPNCSSVFRRLGDTAG